MERKKVLIVDDDPAILDYIKIVIDEEIGGIIADCASSLEEALELLQSGDYGAILSDFYLKRGTIVPLYLENRLKKNLPFALLSGEFPDYIRGWFIDQKVPQIEVNQIAILSKPFDVEELGEWLRSALAITSAQGHESQ